jgi:hypothetical protein
MFHSVEFQKRGLPHAHILIRYAKSCLLAEEIDAVISAELPREDLALRNLIMSFMIHHHSTPPQPISAYCQKEDVNGNRHCRFEYPKTLREHTIIDDNGRVQYRRRHPEDAWVVPHCPILISKYKCHINMEVAGSAHLFQYLFKYIHKGIYQLCQSSLHSFYA